MEKEFEDYWKKHRDSLFLAAPKTLQDEMNNTTKPGLLATGCFMHSPSS